jgi:hypothetical protein
LTPDSDLLAGCVLEERARPGVSGAGHKNVENERYDPLKSHKIQG